MHGKYMASSNKRRIFLGLAPGLRRRPSGNGVLMRKNPYMRPAGAALVLVIVRLLRALFRRRAELAASGELDRRRASRHGEAVDRALRDARLPVTPPPVRREHARAAVTEEVRASFAAAIERAAAEREVSDSAHAPVRARSAEQPWQAGDTLVLSGILAAAGAVALTFVALVEPLEPAAPWLALGGLVLAAGAVLAGRR